MLLRGRLIQCTATACCPMMGMWTKATQQPGREYNWEVYMNVERVQDQQYTIPVTLNYHVHTVYDIVYPTAIQY